LNFYQQVARDRFDFAAGKADDVIPMPAINATRFSVGQTQNARTRFNPELRQI
jgi:hypothetical protein